MCSETSERCSLRADKLEYTSPALLGVDIRVEA